MDWKDFNPLLRKLKILLSVFASKRPSALGQYRFLSMTRQLNRQAVNQLRTFAWFEALPKPQDLVLVLNPLLC